jgi:hypothetical protein
VTVPRALPPREQPRPRLYNWYYRGSNKHTHLIQTRRTRRTSSAPCSAPILFLQEQIKDIIIIAGLSFLTVHVGHGSRMRARLPLHTYSSSTHRFPDERTPIEATPFSATSGELGSGLGLDLGLGSHFSSHAPSHAPLQRLPFTQYSFLSRSLVHYGQTSPHKSRLVVPHSTCSSLSPSPPGPAQTFIIGPAVINTHTISRKE